MPIKKGFFITFEGPEGSGKSSQASLLARELEVLGYSVVTCSDPGSTYLGDYLRKLLLHGKEKISARTEALLFIAGRMQLVDEIIKPSLESGKIVICDRFHDSTIAYQGFGGGGDIEWLDKLGKQAINGMLPDMTILLDVPCRLGFRRIKGRKDRMESKAKKFHEQVRRGYLKIARSERSRVFVVDGSKPKKSIHEKTLEVVLKQMFKRGLPTL